jgi:hypothetical protein
VSNIDPKLRGLQRAANAIIYAAMGSLFFLATAGTYWIFSWLF